jgi:hypothetical protein
MMIVEDRCTILQIWETGDAGTSEEAAMESALHKPIRSVRSPTSSTTSRSAYSPKCVE